MKESDEAHTDMTSVHVGELRARGGLPISAHPLSDRGFDHRPPGLYITGSRHRFVGLAHGVKYRQSLIHVFGPNGVDLVTG
jgi:hypothetical protein